MFIGHHAAALAVKPLFGATILVRVAPGVTAFTPAQWLFVPWGWWIDKHRRVRA